MAYSLKMHPEVEDELVAIAEPIFSKIQTKIAALALDPRPVGVLKIAGHDKTYRIRVGKYRIVYTIDDDELVVVTIAVARRDKVYPVAKRRLKK